MKQTATGFEWQVSFTRMGGTGEIALGTGSTPKEAFNKAFDSLKAYWRKPPAYKVPKESSLTGFLMELPFNSFLMKHGVRKHVKQTPRELLTKINMSYALLT